MPHLYPPWPVAMPDDLGGDTPLALKGRRLLPEGKLLAWCPHGYAFPPKRVTILWLILNEDSAAFTIKIFR